MTTQDATLDGYDWPTCLACGHNLWDTELDRYCCQPCEDGTRTRLKQLPALFAQLNQTAALIPGARKTSGAAPSGSRTAPLPLRLDVIDLVGPGGIATRLQAIEDSWRQALGRRIQPATDGVRIFASWRSNPARAVPGHVEFLVINLQRACEQYESIGQDIDDIRQLHATCTAIVEQKPKIGSVKIGVCPVSIDDGRCAEQLYASARSFKTVCQTCGTTWEGVHEWRQLRAAQQEALAELAGAAA